MKTKLQVEILSQPDDTSCGPTCLHALYNYYGDDVPLEKLIAEIPQLEGGGTLAVMLGCHALRRGYRATIYTYNLNIFDPTWFVGEEPNIAGRLRIQMEAKEFPKLQLASNSYLEFLELGGELRFEDLTTALIRKYLARRAPILTGLSATYLYRSARELPDTTEPDDIAGEPAGHFVVLCGYDRDKREVLVADPLRVNPVALGKNIYAVNIDRLVCSILLGIVTYDANLLILEPKARGN